MCLYLQSFGDTIPPNVEIKIYLNRFLDSKGSYNLSLSIDSNSSCRERNSGPHVNHSFQLSTLVVPTFKSKFIILSKCATSNFP